MVTFPHVPVVHIMGTDYQLPNLVLQFRATGSERENCLSAGVYTGIKAYLSNEQASLAKLILFEDL